MYRLLVIGCLVIVILEGCSSPKKSGNSIKVLADNAAIDSVDYFSKDYTVTHVANEKRVQGTWNVSMMYLAPGSAEKLSGVTLDFTSNNFSSKAPCNRVSGNYVITDFNIKFSNLISTKMACDKLEQETVYLKLLENAVDNFTFSENKLLLKDSKGGVVLECFK